MKSKHTLFILLIALLIGVILFSVKIGKTTAQDSLPLPLTKSQQAFLTGRNNQAENLVISTSAESLPCRQGLAGSFPCANINLLALMTLPSLGATQANDIWGWADPETDREYALVGLNNGVGFVDVTDPVKAQYLGKLPTQTFSSSWRDIKVFRNTAYIVSEAPNHGLQIFDLTNLRDVSSPPVTFTATNHYAGFGNAHNIAINEESGFAYILGSNTCSGGLHIISLKIPQDPSFAGCFSADGYTHDTQCVIYRGQDSRYQGREICFNANEDTLTIVDVTKKTDPILLSRSRYNGSSYTHQGWLTEDHAYLLLGDELDEVQSGNNTRTYIWDLSNLQRPELFAEYTADVPAIDHNLYILDGLVYEANYRSGLRVLDAAGIAQGELIEVAFFDTYPENDDPNYNGAWSVYPFFPSGNLIVSDIDRGLFVVKTNIPQIQFTTYIPSLP